MCEEEEDEEDASYKARQNLGENSLNTLLSLFFQLNKKPDCMSENIMAAPRQPTGFSD